MIYFDIKLFKLYNSNLQIGLTEIIFYFLIKLFVFCFFRKVKMYFRVVCLIFLLFFSLHCEEFSICKQIKISNDNLDDIEKQCVGQTVFVQETEKQKKNSGKSKKFEVQT